MSSLYPFNMFRAQAHLVIIPYGLAIILGIIVGVLSPIYVFWSLILLFLTGAILVNPLIVLTILLIVAPLRALILTEAAFNLPLDIGLLVLILLPLVWFIYRIARQQLLLPDVRSPIVVALAVYLVSLVPGGFFAQSLGMWINEFTKWFIVVAIVVYVMNIAHGQRWKYVIFGVLVAASVNVIVGIYIFFGGSGALHLLVNDRFFRAFGTFGQPNPFGGFMGLAAPLGLMMLFDQSRVILINHFRRENVSLSVILWWLFFLATSLLTVLGVFISWSRGAWLAFTIAVVVMLFALPRKMVQGVVLVGCFGLLFALLGLVGRLPDLITTRVATVTQDLFVLGDVRGVEITSANYANIERLAHWQAAVNMGREYPFFGVGAGNYQAAYDAFRLIDWDESLGHAHNYYLNVFAETGIIGLAAYLSLIMFVLVAMWRLRSHPDQSVYYLSVGLAGSWVYLLIHSLTDNLYVNNLFLHIGAILGVLAVLYRQLSISQRFCS